MEGLVESRLEAWRIEGTKKGHPSGAFDELSE
jgi:hypothetical protein